ncbi:unnamed protein product [Heterobilharzia americana]|nr:unnamed protein product [Heterobilharzia americana]
MEHLLRSVRLVTCTDPLNPCNQLVQLTIAHYMKQCLYDVKCAVYSKSEAMFLVHLFVFCAVGVRSFSNSLLHNIFFRLTNSCPYIPFYVLKGSENNTENATSCVALNFSTVSLVNIIIESLADNILLFPQPVLVLLGNMRLIWSAAGLSQDDVMRASLEFVFNDFIGSSFEEPELFNITLNVTSFPRILQVLKKTVEVILSLVLECDNCLLGTTATNQNTSKVDRNECARIKVEQLQTFVQFVLSAADSMAFTISVLEEHPESVSPNINTPQFDEPKDDIQRNSFGSVVSLTSNDLNVLIDCIRIVLKKKPNSYPFSKLIDRLPCYVPGATIGVQQSLDNVSSENNLKASNSCTNETSAVLVDISKSIAVKTLTRKIIRSNNDTISSQQRRSRSLNNLFSDKLNSVRHLEEVHDEEQDSNRQRQNMKYDSENLEIVYLFDLNFSYHRNHHHHHSNNNSSPVDLVEKTSIPEVTDNGVKINQDYLDVFIKGKVNDHSSTGYGLDGGSLIHGSDESITSSSEYHHSNSKIDTLAKVITNNEQCDVFETQSASPVNITNNLNRDKQLKDNSSQMIFWIVRDLAMRLHHKTLIQVDALVWLVVLMLLDNV